MNKYVQKTLAGLTLALVSSLAFAATPFYDMPLLPQIPDDQLINSNWNAVGANGQNPYLKNLTQEEIQPLVKNMRNFAGVLDDPSLHNAIGLHSGMALRKDGEFTEKTVYNWEGLNGEVLSKYKTENNITWYPDYIKLDANGNNALQGLRFTTGRFNMGKMPFTGQGHLEIPLKNIKKEINGTKVWFKADVKEVIVNGKPKYTTNLVADVNYYEVFGVKSPILDFLGYYDTATGEWKVKIVINNDMYIDPAIGGFPGKIHPKLDMEIYSQGYALQ